MGRDKRRRQDRVHAAILIRVCAEPARPSDSVKVRIARAADRLGWPLRRVEAIWWQQAHRIEAFEMDALRLCEPPPD